MTRRPLIKSVAENVWTAGQLSKFAMMPLGLRSTIIRLPGDKLWVHSPVRLVTERRAEIESLGKVVYLIAPNDYHHLYLGEWQAAYPEARSFLSPGLTKKRPDLKHDAILDDDFIAPWDHLIESCPIHGQPQVHETAFFHTPSRTLILTDLVHHYPGEAGLVTGVLRAVMGTRGFGPSRLSRLATRDKKAKQASIEAILAWDFDRIIMAHGKIVETGGKELMARAFGVA